MITNATAKRVISLSIIATTEAKFNPANVRMFISERVQKMDRGQVKASCLMLTLKACFRNPSNAQDQKRAGTLAKQVFLAPVFCILMLCVQLETSSVSSRSNQSRRYSSRRRSSISLTSFSSTKNPVGGPSSKSTTSSIKSHSSIVNPLV